MLLNEIRPSAALAEFVRCYRIIDFSFPESVIIPAKAYTPRPEHCLQFIPIHDSEIYYADKPTKRRNMRTPTFLGQQTSLHYRTVPREIISIQVVFQPSTIFRWFGLPSNQLTNQFIDADYLFSKQIHSTNEQLAFTNDYNEMIRIVECFLMGEANKFRRNAQPIDHVFSNFLKLNIGSIEAMADQACLSYRQFDRKFIERTGISPKEYFRVARFDQTFRIKNRYPELDWLSIAMKFGYYDYQHLVKDYKYFVGLSPHQLFSGNHAPEKILGDAET